MNLSGCLNLFSIWLTVKSHNHYKMEKMWYSMDSNSHSRCLMQWQIRKNWVVFQGQFWRNAWKLKETSENLGSIMINLCHTTKDRKSRQQILQIFIFMSIGWGSCEWKTRWRQNVPLENCRWSHLTFNPNIFM